MKTVRFVPLLAVGVVAAGLARCSDGGGGDPTPDPLARCEVDLSK